MAGFFNSVGFRRYSSFSYSLGNGATNVISAEIVITGALKGLTWLFKIERTPEMDQNFNTAALSILLILSIGFLWSNTKSYNDIIESFQNEKRKNDPRSRCEKYCDRDCAGGTLQAIGKIYDPIAAYKGAFLKTLGGGGALFTKLLPFVGVTWALGLTFPWVPGILFAQIALLSRDLKRTGTGTTQRLLNSATADLASTEPVASYQSSESPSQAP